MTDSITVTELEALLKDKERLTLLDVRRKSDYLATPRKISSALWQDPENTVAWAEQLPKDHLTVVYCVRGGSVSRSVADQLHQEGLETVFLEGGLQAWVENGGAVG
jgi:rhodanese-related sulfurtransferase